MLALDRLAFRTDGFAEGALLIAADLRTDGVLLGGDYWAAARTGEICRSRTGVFLDLEARGEICADSFAGDSFLGEADFLGELFLGESLAGVAIDRYDLRGDDFLDL